MIKKIHLIFCFILLAATVQAQSQLDDIVNAVRSSRVSDIKKYFDNTVPITINSTQSIYSRSQAEIVLKDFFRDNNPKDLVIENSGSPDNTSQFAIGSFNTANGKYNIYILLKMKGRSSYLVQEIRVDKE
jgi:hypothetical protein